MPDPKPPAWLKAMNKVMMRMQKLGIVAGPVRVLTVPGRRPERVAFAELSAEQARPVLRAFPEKVPRGVEFYKRSGLVARGTADEFEALAGRCAVFRLDTVPAS